MRHQTLLILAITVTHAYAAPQFVTFNDGKLGVNFGGYHAGVGLGGLLGGGGAGGGLFAEAGTPYGQEARAGLGGAVNEKGGASAGGLYAGATAGGNVKAAAGLAGGVDAEKSAGSGYATAQSGNHYAGSGLGGASSLAGSGGFSFSGTKSINIPATVVKETKVSVVPVETVKPIHKKVHTEINLEATNEINHPPARPVVNSEVGAKAEFGGGFNVNSDVKPVVYKEVYVEPQPVVVEKHIIHTHYKPHRHHFHKTAYIGGYIGGGAGGVGDNIGHVGEVQPTVEKINVNAQSYAHAGGEANVQPGGGQVQFTKQVRIEKNPQFFQDIFNIPISTLKAVSDFLGGVTANTNISVQKSASVHAGSYA